MNDIITDIQIKALVDHVRTSLKYKDEPSIICQKSRVTCEYILALIWHKEFNEYPTGKMLQSLCDGIIKNRPSLIPLGIQTLIGTIQVYGNKTSHAHENFEQLDLTHANIVESALSGLCNWFFIDYLNANPVPDFKLSEDSVNAQLSSYRELLSSIFSDGILELEEYEKIVDARESLGLDMSQCEIIESEIIKKYINKPFQHLVDLLKPADLRTFKQKSENKIYAYSPWVLKAFDEISNTRNIATHALILSEYFNEISGESKMSIPLCIQYLGCWQGWYMQSQINQTKTFYDLTFVALSKDEFVGISFEPLNPNWWSIPDTTSDILVASIKGSIENDIIISFKKEYLIEETWQIDYQAVITEEGKYFEGDWEIVKQSGPFNAIKTRSLLPVHIYDVDNNIPITKIMYLDNLRNLTSTWFFQLTGKDRFYGLLHMIEINDVVYANLLFADEDNINLSYLSGNYDGMGNVILKKENDIIGETSDMLLRFAIDWTMSELNGTVKDDIHKIRGFKAFKI